MPMDASAAYNELRTKFMMSKPAKKLIKENNLKFKYGFFSAKESAVLREAVLEFLAKNKLELTDLEKYLTEDAAFPIHDLVLHAVSKLEYRTFKAVHTHITFVYHPMTASRFMENEDVELLNLVGAKGFRWKAIGMVLAKYRDQCRKRYLLLKGLQEKYLGTREIKKIVSEGIPRSEQEWIELCLRLGISKARLVKRIDKYLKSATFSATDTYYHDIVLCTYIISLNYYCAMSVDPRQVIEFLANGARQYIEQHVLGSPAHPNEPAADNGAPAPSAILPSGNAKDPDAKANEPALHKDASATDDTAPNARDSDPKHRLLSNIIANKIKIANEATEQTNKTKKNFNENFKQLFRLEKMQDLDIGVEIDDIFWGSIAQELGLEVHALKSKFYGLCSSHGFRTFRDIYDAVLGMAYDYFIDQIKQRLLERTKRPRREAASG